MTKYLSTSMLIALGDRREKLVHTSDGILSALLSWSRNIMEVVVVFIDECPELIAFCLVNVVVIQMKPLASSWRRHAIWAQWDQTPWQQFHQYAKHLLINASATSASGTHADIDDLICSLFNRAKTKCKEFSRQNPGLSSCAA